MDVVVGKGTLSAKAARPAHRASNGGSECGMLVDDALGGAGRAGGVDHKGGIVGSVCRLVEGGGVLGDGRAHEGLVDDEVGLAVTHDQIDALLGIGRAERGGDSARAHDAQKCRDVGGTAL